MITERETQYIQKLCPGHWKRILERLSRYEGTLQERLAAQESDQADEKKRRRAMRVAGR